jgi:methyl-accepting chemotaxis protein
MLTTISRKLVFGNSVIIVLFVANLLASLYLTGQTLRDAQLVRDEAAAFALKAKDLQFATLQVQQWLTDISATRGAEGYNDGFDEAETNAAKFREMLGEFKTFYKSKELAQELAKTDDLEKAFNNYYTVGIEMANTYIADGPTGGNAIMKKFDPAAEAITTQIEQLVSFHTGSLSEAMNSVVDQATFQQRLGYLLCFGGILFATVSSWFVSRSILLPIRQTTSALKTIADGSGDLSCRLNDQRSDEFGEVGKHFNRFVSQIETIVQAIGQQAKRLEGSSGVLGKVSVENADESDQLKLRSSTVATAAKQLDDMMTHSAAYTDDLSSNAKQIAAAVDELTLSITDVARGAERAASVANHTSQLATSADQTIATLDSAAAEIGRVIDVIQEIAEQTNLLALNATIEAARAGDAGRGFAVVATEVKELAKQTALATDDIRNRIGGIQSSSREVVGSIREITQAIQRVSEESRTIAGAVEEQSITARQLAGTVAQSSASSERVARNTAESSSVAKSMIDEFVSIDQGIGQISCSSTQAKERVLELLNITESLELLVRKYN